MKFTFLLFLLIPLCLLAKNKIVTYDPQIIQLTGKLDLQTFPGPPNYDNIKMGDEIERHFYIKLDTTVDVIPLKNGHPSVINVAPELNVKIMQLSVNAEDEALWTTLRKMGTGVRLKIVGFLFHKWTGHHHSRVILNVKTIEAIQ